MMWPRTAVQKYADAADGVDLVYSTGTTVIDQVIDSLMDTANREILMSRFFQHSAVQTCEFENGKGVAIQNFAQSVSINEDGAAEVKKLSETGDFEDLCSKDAKNFDDEKLRL